MSTTQTIVQRRFYFFIGTVAEFLKIMPVMQELSKRNVPFKVIASGQNPLTVHELFAFSGITGTDIVLNDRPIRKSALGLFGWFAETLIKGLVRLRKEFRGQGKGTTLVVHGDTVSTVMGALIGRCYGLRVAHVEAGLRSFNFLQPFPEELDRCLTAFLADVHFAPYQQAVHNLRKRKGVKIDTGFNTNIDSLMFALSQNRKPQIADTLQRRKYFIFIMHRQENLANEKLVRKIVDAVVKEARTLQCIFVMHELTRASLERFGLLPEIERNPDVIVTGRLPYVEFVGLLNEAEFIITDGGGNQQESYYLGKPCLLLRSVTEGSEGLGHNVLVSYNDIAVIQGYMSDYMRYRKPMVRPEVRPSEIIADVLLRD